MADLSDAVKLTVPISIRLRNRHRRALASHSSVYVSDHKFPMSDGPGYEVSKSFEETAQNFVNTKFPDAFYSRNNDAYIDTNGVGHVYFTQKAEDGTIIRNYDLNVNISPSGAVFSHGQHFRELRGELKKPPSAEDALAAFQIAGDTLRLPIVTRNAKVKTEKPAQNKIARGWGVSSDYVITGAKGVISDPTAKLLYWGMANGTIIPAWEVEINLGESWYMIHVHAATKEIICVHDHVSHAASFEVYPLSIPDPSQGPRTIFKDPWGSNPSWLSDGEKSYKTTQGNNAIAQENPRLISGFHEKWRYLPKPKKKLRFHFNYNPEKYPREYRDASITQAFYTVNKAHDIFYKLGFNEKAGNFQQNNFNRGGLGGDFVSVNVQVKEDPVQDHFSNAYFLTTPDGKPPILVLKLFYDTTVPRDSAFDTRVVLHEYTHGLSNRLTGGPGNHNCIRTWEALGMGEGWSDFMAIAMTLNSTHVRQDKEVMGAWLSNNTDGARNYPYSTDCGVNPVVYTDLDKYELMDEQTATFYDNGNLWANILFDMMWNLIEKYPIQDTDGPQFKSKTQIPTDGRYLAMKLVMDAMALQPCNPNMIQARDAILDADTIVTQGENHCEIWRAFAKRHMGVSAKHGRLGDYENPSKLGFKPKKDDPGYRERKGDTTMPPGVCVRTRFRGAHALNTGV